MRLFGAIGPVGVALLAWACSGGDADGGPASGGAGPGLGGAGGGGTGSGGSAGGPPPPPTSELAPGWQKSFSDSPPSIGCDATLEELAASGAPSLAIGGATLVVGYEQSGQNQNPVVARFDGQAQSFCEHHEQEPPDGRAYGITWDGGPIAYVVYTIVGGGSAFDAAAEGGWLSSYGSGGGPKVTFVGEVDAASGALVRGSYVIAMKQDGKTNGHSPTDAVVRRADGRLEVHGSSAFQPLNPDRSIMQCTDYPFLTKYVLSADFATLDCSTSTNCTGSAPCP